MFFVFLFLGIWEHELTCEDRCASQILLLAFAAVALAREERAGPISGSTSLVVRVGGLLFWAWAILRSPY